MKGEKGTKVIAEVHYKAAGKEGGDLDGPLREPESSEGKTRYK